MDDALDYVVFDSVYNGGGGSSSKGSDGNDSMWAKIMAVITLLAILRSLSMVGVRLHKLPIV